MIAQIDLENQFGERRVREWSDDAGTGQARAEHAQQALNTAKGTYETYLLALPDPLTDMAKWILCAIAGYRLAARRESPEKMEVLRVDYEDAISLLKAAQKSQNNLAPASLAVYQVDAATEFPE